MGRAASLTDQQKGTIIELSTQLVPERNIAEYIGKSKTVIHNFILKEKSLKQRKNQVEPNRYLVPKSMHSSQTLLLLIIAPVSVNLCSIWAYQTEARTSQFTLTVI